MGPCSQAGCSCKDRIVPESFLAYKLWLDKGVFRFLAGRCATDVFTHVPQYKSGRSQRVLKQRRSLLPARIKLSLLLWRRFLLRDGASAIFIFVNECLSVFSIGDSQVPGWISCLRRRNSIARRREPPQHRYTFAKAIVFILQSRIFVPQDVILLIQEVNLNHLLGPLAPSIDALPSPTPFIFRFIGRRIFFGIRFVKVNIFGTQETSLICGSSSATRSPRRWSRHGGYGRAL